MEEVAMIRPVEGSRPSWTGAVLSALTGALLYLAFWGSVSSMCALYNLGVIPLCAGGILLLLLRLLHLHRSLRRTLFWIVLAAAAALALLRLTQLFDGCKLLLNRLFQASAARHRYIYETFSTTGSGSEGIKWSLLILGLVSGALLGVWDGAKTRICALFFPVLLLSTIAWLGISPRPVWMIILAAAILLQLFHVDEIRNPAILPLTIAAVLAVLAVCLWMPGKNAAISTWEESARDRLALRTVYYGESEQLQDRREKQENKGTAASGKKAFYRQEETGADEGEGTVWKRPLTIGLLILLVLLMLFGPAFLSDRIKRKQAANRAGLEDPDLRKNICSSFLYGLRYLREAGLIEGNKPFSAYLPVLAAMGEELAQAFEAAVPIWQEAAYSSNELTEEQRRTIQRFKNEAMARAEARMNWRQRLRVRYVTAL